MLHFITNFPHVVEEMNAGQRPPCVLCTQKVFQQYEVSDVPEGGLCDYMPFHIPYTRRVSHRYESSDAV